MKYRLFSILLFTLSFTKLFSQGQIISITTVPVNPTTADSVTVYVELLFNYGGCNADHQAHSTNGNITTATALHCMGMLTVMCPITDTFELGYLQAGNHQFNFTLSSGSGGPGCSPGIVPDDSDILNFTVTSALGVNENNSDKIFQLFPNPSSENVVLNFNSRLADSDYSVTVTDIAGKEIYSQTLNGVSSVTLPSELFLKGMYLVMVSDKSGIIASEKWIRN